MRGACRVLVLAGMAASSVIAAAASPVAAAASTTALRPVEPCRLADTRTGAGFTRVDAKTVRVQVSGRCGVDGAATAAALTVTVDRPSGNGFVTVYPAGTGRPTASNLNYQPGEIVSNGVIVSLSPSGAVDVYTHVGAPVIVDVTGGFVPATSATSGRFVPVTPTRMLDTRQSGGALPAGGSRTVALPAGVPADAVAVTANVTATQTSGAGTFVAHASGAPRPTATALSVDASGQTRAAASVIPTSSGGFTVYSQSGGHLVVDVTGYFTGPSASSSATGLFVPTSPTRLLDTRGVSPLGNGVPLYPNGAVQVASPVAAASLALNVTTVLPSSSGWVVAYPAQNPQPPTSTVNSDRAGDTQANLWVGAQSTAGVVFAQSSATTAHLVVDMNGWFTGQPVAAASPSQPVLNAAPIPDPLGPITSPNRGTWCAAGTDAASLNSFFSQARGSFYGADYQRAYRLPDGRVLWMFQDAFITNTAGQKTLQHNVGMIQSGRCFSLLRAGTAANPKSWIMWDKTVNRQTWYWPMGGEVSPDGKTFHLFMAEMKERGGAGAYLKQTEPTAMYIVNIRISDLTVTGYALAPNPSGVDLYGWSVTSDASWTYLYGHCYKQFGWGFLGHDACTQYMKVARVPKGQPWATPQYWNGSGWVSNAAAATPVVSSATFGGSINPGQVIFDGTKFVLIVKEGDWWGNTVYVGTSPSPTGPWTLTSTAAPTAKCSSCNTYFASWVPWRNGDGSLIWGLSHNRWDGAISSVYRPSFHRVVVDDA